MTTFRQPTPAFSISPQAQVDVLDKLPARNHYRYDQEVKQGPHLKKTARKGSRGTTAMAAERPGSTVQMVSFP